MTVPHPDLPAPTAPRPADSARAVWIALLIATLIKGVWALTSAGSVDVVLFFDFARGVEKLGLCALYPIEVRFNHTPLTGSFAALLYRLAKGDYLEFAFYLRLASVLADATVVAGLVFWREKLSFRAPWWALVLFAASPVSIMVSGFHGNVDPIMVAVLFFAAAAAAFQRPVLCGLLFGLACNVKIVPIVFAPVFFFFWFARGRPWRFVLASGAVMLAGSALPLVVCPRAYLHNVFGYGSIWGVWGFPYLLHLTGWEAVQKIDFHDLTAVQNGVATALKFAAVTGILWVAWQRRRIAADAFPTTLGLAWVIFFVFAPGVGVQYMVWFAPFLLLFNARGYAAVTGMATIFLFVFYQSTSKDGRFPWFMALPMGPEAPLWSACGTLTWLAFVGLLIAACRWPSIGGERQAAPAVSPRDIPAAASRSGRARGGRGCLRGWRWRRATW